MVYPNGRNLAPPPLNQNRGGYSDTRPAVLQDFTINPKRRGGSTISEGGTVPLHHQELKELLQAPKKARACAPIHLAQLQDGRVNGSETRSRIIDHRGPKMNRAAELRPETRSVRVHGTRCAQLTPGTGTVAVE